MPKTTPEFERAEERLVDALRDLANAIEAESERNPFDAPTKAERRAMIKRVKFALGIYVNA